MIDKSSLWPIVGLTVLTVGVVAWALTGEAAAWWVAVVANGLILLVRQKRA